MKHMQHVNLGPTDIKVSPICIGGMSFGKVFADFHQWVIDQPSTQAVIKHALELGVNFIDTANTYAHGTSEEYIGQSLRNLGVHREDVVLASKVYFNEGKLSSAAIAREIEGTLKRLGTDYLDLYIIHRFDYDTPIEETMEPLDALVRTGKVRALGASAMYAYQLHNMQVVADAHGWTRFASMQCHYNLLYREDEREMIPVCKQYGMALTPYSPLASGHLTRPTWDSTSVRSTTDGTMRKKYDPVGCSRPSRVDDAVRALDVQLTDEDLAYLEELYQAHELVGPLARPGERPLAGTTVSKA
jgi:aryl-alcohol dehydrogenase-like predicted oxidoreductase